MNPLSRAAILPAVFAAAALAAGCASTSPVALDLDGNPLNPFVPSNAPATVLVFVSTDCPISNRYAPELRRLEETYTRRGVCFWLVYADPDETSAEIREHNRQYGLAIRSVRDPHHQLVRLADAEVTPTAAVFVPGKRLVYHGRIDDRVVDLGREHPQPMHHDLAEALDSILAGRPVPVATTKAIGCYIPGR